MVTSPIRTFVACNSSVIRVSGEAFQPRPRHGFLQVLARRVNLDQEPSLTRIGPPGRIHDHQIGPQSLAMLGHDGLEGLLDALALGDHLVGKLQHILQHELDPGHVDGPIRPPALLAILPFLVSQADSAVEIRVVGQEPLGKCPHQHRQGKKRAGDLDQ